MLQYEWENGNPSYISLSGDEPAQEGDPTRSIFNYSSATPAANQDSYNGTFVHHQSTGNNTSGFIHPSHFQTPAQAQLQSIYNARAYPSASAYGTPPLASFLEPVSGGSGGGYFLVPKTEEDFEPVDFTTRIGLNLGGRTYFSSDDFVSRLYGRSRPGDVGPLNTPRCQVEGCNADLTHAKHYHRRHKVCELHSKAATVVAAGLTQRFCQQCSRFHLLSEFDNGKRSCRRRLADHNRRRRKSQQKSNMENQTSQPETARTSSTDSLTRSPADSGVQSPSSVSVAISPPRMSLDCFPQRSRHATASSSSLFFSSG